MLNRANCPRRHTLSDDVLERLDRVGSAHLGTRPLPTGPNAFIIINIIINHSEIMQAIKTCPMLLACKNYFIYIFLKI